MNKHKHNIEDDDYLPPYIEEDEESINKILEDAKDLDSLLEGLEEESDDENYE